VVGIKHARARDWASWRIFPARETEVPTPPAAQLIAGWAAFYNGARTAGPGQALVETDRGAGSPISASSAAHRRRTIVSDNVTGKPRLRFYIEEIEDFKIFRETSIGRSQAARPRYKNLSI